MFLFSVALCDEAHFDRMFTGLRPGDGMHVISTSKSPQDVKSQHSCAALALIEPDDFVQTCSAQLAFQLCLNKDGGMGGRTVDIHHQLLQMNYFIDSGLLA